MAVDHATWPYRYPNTYEMHMRNVVTGEVRHVLAKAFDSTSALAHVLRNERTGQWVLDGFVYDEQAGGGGRAGTLHPRQAGTPGYVP
jgi:hypothetical protein